MIDHPIIGAWRLREWRITLADGRVRHPFGEDARGRILYSADGHMLAAISRAEPVALGEDNPRQAADRDKAAAFDAYFSYGGRFRIDGEHVVHEVDIALNPALLGTRQRRLMRFSGTELTLSAQEIRADGERVHRLTWTRSPSA